MDKHVNKSYIEKDREDELFLRLAQVNEQIDIISFALLGKNNGVKEVLERLEIIRHLLDWYVSGQCEESWKSKLEELPQLLSFNEKLHLMSSIYMCNKIVTRLQDMLLPWKDENKINNIDLNIINELSIKVMFLKELLASNNVKKQYPHFVHEACDPKDWFMN
jgi:hypothetical protein